MLRRSNMPYIIRDVIEGRMPIDFVIRRGEKSLFVLWCAGCDGFRGTTQTLFLRSCAYTRRGHSLAPLRHPERAGFPRACGSIHFCFGRRLPESSSYRCRSSMVIWPHQAAECSPFLSCVFLANALAASRTQRPSSWALLRASRRSLLQGPLPFNTW